MTLLSDSLYRNVNKNRARCYLSMIYKYDKMVEEIVITNKPRVKTARPKPVYLWTVVDVQKWYRRHCADFLVYSELLSKHEITGKALLRITDNSLQRMGITNNRDREAIWREIVKQRLKTDIMEIRDLERMHIY